MPTGLETNCDSERMGLCFPPCQHHAALSRTTAGDKGFQSAEDKFEKKMDYRKQRQREIPLGGSNTRHFILKRSQMHYG
ncbi:hypothetical protein AMELA_G00269770 [Ameiurus melas]|uniref:Uncharacterized protein n=1 Tax=Ameiurus melas TaxID=219545 RepID=A0A7J5ZS20_AMEME|nr:hypothetical protein AMELA_G00269770 [Ameiurus melas]